MPTLIPHPQSLKRNIDLRRVLDMLARHPGGMSAREIREGMSLAMRRCDEYIITMRCGSVIDRLKSSVDGKKAVYRYCVVADQAQIEAFLDGLAAQFSKPMGKQRQAIRMPTKRVRIGPPKKLTTRSNTVTDLQQTMLKRMQNMYDFIAANPGCGMLAICAHYGKASSTLRAPLHHLRDGGYIDAKVGKRTFQGQNPTSYSIADIGRPTTPPQRKPILAMAERAMIDPMIKRIIKPAKQLGMAPYADLPMDFFRPAVAA